MEPIEGSETSAFKPQTPGNYPIENILHKEHGESLKSRNTTYLYNNLKMISLKFHSTSKSKEVVISNIMHHLQNPKEKNEVLISKLNSINEMKVKHKRRHRK